MNLKKSKARSMVGYDVRERRKLCKYMIISKNKRIFKNDSMAYFVNLNSVPYFFPSDYMILQHPSQCQLETTE